MSVPDLRFGQFQSVTLAVFFTLALLLAILFTVIAMSSRRDVEYATITRIGYWIRKRWLIFLLALATIQLGVAFTVLPYSNADDPDQVVKVTGYQFNWTIDKTSVPAGSLVRFDVESTDVNHGLGVYDPDGVMLGTVQAMPGYTNSVDIRLEKPGEYLIACLEFCGINHHKMLRNLKAVKE